LCAATRSEYDKLKGDLELIRQALDDQKEGESW
jgi:hypothetical protein